MDIKDITILIQGPSTHITEQKKAWEGFNLLFSTWKNCEHLYEKNDNVIFNDIPIDLGPANFWAQQNSTIQGLYELKKQKSNFVLKIRSDLIPTNSKNFLNCLNKNNLNFLCWHEHMVYPECPGYLCDYLMAGPIDSMIKLWDIRKIFCSVPEIMITWNCINQCFDVDKQYFLNCLNLKNDLFWIKNNIYLSSYKLAPTPDLNKKFYFSSDNYRNLNINYLSFLKK